MRSEIIQSLGYPRYLMQSQRDLVACPHCGSYAQDDPRCQNCVDGFECQWLHSHDEFAALEQKPERTLIEALEFAIQYVEGFLLPLRHSRASCRCESCRWMRAAVRLLAESREAISVNDANDAVDVDALESRRPG